MGQLDLLLFLINTQLHFGLGKLNPLLLMEEIATF